MHQQIYTLFSTKMPNGFISVDFEDILYNTEMTLERVIDYIGVKPAKDYAKNISEENQDYFNKMRFREYETTKFLPYFPEFLAFNNKKG